MEYVKKHDVDEMRESMGDLIYSRSYDPRLIRYTLRKRLEDLCSLSAYVEDCFVAILARSDINAFVAFLLPQGRFSDRSLCGGFRRHRFPGANSADRPDNA